MLILKITFQCTWGCFILYIYHLGYSNDLRWFLYLFKNQTWHMWGRRGSFLARFDNSIGQGWIRPLAGHSQLQTPFWPALERNPLGIAPPPQPKQQYAHPKVNFAQRCSSKPFFFCPAQVLSPSQWWAVLYHQTKEETTITLGHWSALSGLKRHWWGKAVGVWVGGRVAQRSQRLLGNHSACLSLHKVPHHTPPTTPSRFFFPSLVTHKAPSWVKATGFCKKLSGWYLRGFLLTHLKNERSKKMNEWIL